MSADLQYSPDPAAYDAFAEAYTAETESNLINGYYTRPAILELAGDVAGRRILDVGCGAGPLLETLRDRGAVVTGVEPSIRMLDLARRRLGPGTALHLGGLGGDPLPFPDAAFDDVIACLVLHYVQDWAAALAELRRVLVPGGRLLVAVNHPFMYKLLNPDGDYFATEPWRDDFTFDGRTFPLTFWHRPLHTILNEFVTAGFRITVVSEPPPAPEAHELFPDLETSPSGSFLCFLFLGLEAA
ncbi:class I SAM-dependent methyltransferase [Actinoplanes sp. L3-i22]|uniref:class I SAM-dependent methyltransferase n=1 Tax=Actinoplanes sp. L3-i22 TaxID=2836373 RepID=UPI001C844A0E|nr:class I SAM-dependent methyltransferase [Actinoplanes sp. L3-i22]